MSNNQKLPQNKPVLNKKKPKGNNPKFNPYWIYFILGGFLLVVMYMSAYQNKAEAINENTFINEILPTGDVKEAVVFDDQNVEVYIYPDSLAKKKRYEEIKLVKGVGTVNRGPHYKFSVASAEAFKEEVKAKADQYPAAKNLSITYTRNNNLMDQIIMWGITFAIIIGIWIFMMRRMSGGMGGGGQIFNIGRSKAVMYEDGKNTKVTFNDVAGLDEAKEEVMEIVDFLKKPEKYTKLGGKIPKGALLVGPPGTGKTLLAKAMAGEAKVPFFSMSGSDFVEMFVGVGASRVRDLFKQAREKAPCIVFVDEIDAIGRARGKSMMQSNDERENTLNQILVEMDGFGSDKAVIILAATNRPDVLDSALLRPGRFDRQIGIDRPDLNGREKIFKVHLKPIKTKETVDASKLAAQTPGFVGADIANICNEAALIAARRNREAVEMQDFQDAIDRAIGGLEKKNKLISPEEKEIVAYHEAGHAICGWFLEHAHPLVKVSIVPRGIAALGYAQYLPKEKFLERKEEILDRMCMTLGGRAAEKVVFDKISTGAQSDLDQVTKSALAMTSVYGMSDKVGHVSYYDLMEKSGGFSKPYSEETAQLIDEEIRVTIEQQYERAQKLLIDKREHLENLAKALLEKEVLFKDDLERIIGPRPFKQAEDKDSETTDEASVKA